MLLEDAIKKLKVIIGKPVRYITRSVNIINLGIGNTYQKKTKKGVMYEVAEFALHIQSPFRLTENEDIILGSDDLWVEPKSDLSKGMNEDKHSYFYFRTIYTANEIKNQNIEDVMINDFGDLVVCMGKFKLIVFNLNSSSELETWRFFKTKCDEPHVVCYGNRFFEE